MTISQELSELGNAIADALKRARDEHLTGPLRRLNAACDEIARSWSGSNIGYHATVYYAGLQPKPAAVQFIPEWGLMDRWPSHSPDPGWRIMDHQAVVAELLSRAGVADLSTIESAASELRETLSTLKEQAVSMLSVALRQQKDEFLQRQLKQIEAITAQSPGEVAAGLTSGSHWSRDSAAMSQGMTLAPHQSVCVLPLSAQQTETGLETLQRSVRLCSEHLRRAAAAGNARGAVGTRVVIGHGGSPLWRELKDFVKDQLGLQYDEFNRVQVAGIPNTVRLTQMLEEAAFAFIVLTGEDEQADGSVRARQNVIHEAGLFQSRLGFARAIVLLEEGTDQFSNIEGLGQIRFPKGNIRAAFEEIRRVLQREGILK